MTQPTRRLVLLVPVCLLASATWLSGCRPASRVPPEKSATSAALADPAEPREVDLHPDGTAVTSLTYDSRVFFDFDQDRPRPGAAAVLDALAARLKRQSPLPHVAVLGHTDAIGSDAYNLDLSRRRAVAVVRALVARGVEASRLDAVAIGKRQPVASDDTEAGRARNRRVEFLISPSVRAIAAVLRARPQTLVLRARRPAAMPLHVREPVPLVRAPLGPPMSY